MDIRYINKHISVSPQISIEDIQTIVDLGFKSIVCHRPDGEGADQVSFTEIQKAAEALGVEIVYQPVISGKVMDEDAALFKTHLDKLPSPMFAYCRTGTRSITLWALAQANELSTTEILQTTKLAGYDMSGVVRRIVNGG